VVNILRVSRVGCCPSFNDSEPIVCTPTDAIITFRKSGIDALIMDDVVLTARN
jgi:carbamoyltransferase